MIPLLATFVLGPGRIGHATRSQILAVLPPSLRIVDRPDPAGEALYRSLERLAKRLQADGVLKGVSLHPDAAARTRVVTRAKPVLIELERVLQGSLRWPTRSDPLTSFPEMSGITALAKIVSLAANDAAAKRDHAGCARYVLLGLKLGERLVGAKGATIETITAVGVEAIADRAAYEADTVGGLDAKGRQLVLARLPSLQGPMPEATAILRREFLTEKMPVLLDPIHGFDSVYPDSMALAKAVRKPEPTPGNYDPLATARLVGRMYDFAIADAKRPVWAQKGWAAELAGKAEGSLPQGGRLSKKDYAAKMNAIPNSLGLLVASTGVFDGMANVGALRAARRDLVRAVLLLRMGRPANLPDPFARGMLKVDRKRRIVWSVGRNLKDDGGRTGKGEPDLGYRY